MDQIKSEWTYLQFQKDINLPIYIKIEVDNFDSHTIDFLNTQGFSKIEESEGISIEKKISTILNGRMLTIKGASVGVSRQIESTVYTDKFGQESITAKPGYKVYRYKSAGLLIYSYGASEWQLAVYDDFGSEKCLLSSVMIITRFLGWALAPCGILGIWGSPVEEGLVVMNPSKSLGESVLIDIRERKLITREGVQNIKGIYKILRLDSTLSKRNIAMKSEELISFLCQHITFFDHNGPTLAVRQLVHTISKSADGIIHPEESFRPRADLSL